MHALQRRRTGASSSAARAVCRPYISQQCACVGGKCKAVRPRDGRRTQPRPCHACRMRLYRLTGKRPRSLVGSRSTVATSSHAWLLQLSAIPECRACRESHLSSATRACAKMPCVRQRWEVAAAVTESEAARRRFPLHADMRLCQTRSGLPRSFPPRHPKPSICAATLHPQPPHGDGRRSRRYPLLMHTIIKFQSCRSPHATHATQHEAAHVPL